MLPYQNLFLEDMPGEVWKDVPGYEGHYQVSNLGRAKSIGHLAIARAGKTRRTKTRILKQQLPAGRKYLSFVASNGSKQERKYTHKIVSLLFVSNPENKPCVDHINTNTLDNRSENLRWVTYHENSSNPLTKYHNSLAKSGEKCFFYGKIFGARAIVAIFPDGTEKRYNSIASACREDGFVDSGVHYCLSGKIKHHHGCIFRYDD